jgi:PAS domain S-box-containing protein
MLGRRFGLKSFVVASLAITATVFGTWPLLQGAWFPGAVFLPQNGMLLACGAATSLLVTLLAALVIHRRCLEALHSELQFRSFLDAAPDAVVIMNQAGRIVLVNAQAERLFGCGREEMLGQPVERWLHRRARDEHRADCGNDFSSLSTSRDGSGAQFVGRRRDGHEIALEISFSPLETGAGPLTINILRDITAQEQAERRRATRHAVRRILSEAATVRDATRRVLAVLGEGLGWDSGAVWLVDRQANLLRRTDRWQSPTREPQSAAGDDALAPGTGLAGRVWLTGEPLWVPEGLPGAEAAPPPAAAEGWAPGTLAFPIAVNAEVLGAIECRVRGTDQADEPLLETLGGVGSLVAQFVQRKRAEEAALRLAAIVESSDEAIIGETLDGTITSWNRGAERLYGYPAAEALGRPIAMLFPPGGRDSVAGILHVVRQGRAIEHHETEWLCKDGRRTCVSVTVSPIRDAAGQVVGASAISRNITERKCSENLLAAEKQVLELIAGGASLTQVLEVLARTVDRQAAGMRSCILLLDAERGRFRPGAAPGLPVAFRVALDGLAVDPAVLCCGAAVARGECVVAADLAADPLWQDFRGPAREHGLRACWSAPILSAEGKVLGTYDLYQQEPRAPARSTCSCWTRSPTLPASPSSATRPT